LPSYAGVRVHDDCRGSLRAVGDPGREELLLDLQLEPGIDGQAQVGAGRAGLADDAIVEVGLAARVTLGDDDPRLAGQRRLVLLLDAVLAAALAIDEAEEMRRQRRTRPATDLRVDALGLGLERQREEPLGSDRRTDPVGKCPVQAVAQDQVFGVSGHLVAQRGRVHLVQGEDPGQLLHRGPATLGCQLVRRRYKPFTLEGRGQHDGACPVVDVAALAGRIEGDRGLGHGLAGQPFAVDDLPVRQPSGEQRRADDEDG